MSADTAQTNKVAKDFVYIGARLTDKNELTHGICLVQEDGTLGRPVFYGKVKKFNKTVGGIYTGASFDENTAYGLSTSSWKGRWHDKGAVMEWEALNTDAAESLRASKMEKEAGRITLVEQAMQPIREQYTSARKRNDWAAMEALEHMVMRALRTPIRIVERE